MALQYKIKGTRKSGNFVKRSINLESSISKYFKTPPESPQSDDYKFCETEFANSSLNYQERWHSECRYGFF